VAIYKERHRSEINSYIARNGKEIASTIPRSSPIFRMAEADNLLATLVERIVEQLAIDAVKAVPMMKAYLQMLEFMGKQAGNFQGGGDAPNTFLEAMQKSSPEERVKLTQLMAELDLMCREIMKRDGPPKLALPRAEPRIVDAEFEAEDK
jgi:hypothetical protein